VLALLSLLCVPLVSGGCRRAPEPAAKADGKVPAASRSAPAVESEDVPSRTPRPAGGREAVIWLALDGLDWELLDRLTAEGRMPNWKRLTTEGYTATLKSFMPVLSPVVWTSVATGATPDVHRVLDFQEVDAATGQKEPISGESRAVPAIWNVASAAGLKVGVVGWWATHPAEEVSGFFVTDHASPILFQGLPRAGVAYPVSLTAGVEQIITRDGVVKDEELAAYVDEPVSAIALARGGAKGLENPYVALASILGATRVQQRIARELYDRNQPDLMILYLEGTDGIGHVFASYVPPKMDCVSDADYARYKRTVDEYYALVDKVLGQWMRRAEEDGATLVVNSDHGFKWGTDRTCERSSLNPGTAAYWHRIDGVFAAWGSRVRKGLPRGQGSVYDMVPTVSALLGLPVDKTLKGSVLRTGFDGLKSSPKKDLFGTVPVRRVEMAALSEKDADEYAQSLRNLGYLSGSEPTKLAPTGGTRPGLTEGGWNNLGLFEREAGNYAAAEAAFRKALESRPGYHSPQFNMAVLYRLRGEDKLAIEWLFRSLQAGHAEPENTVLSWFGEYDDKKKLAAAAEVLERGARAYPADERIGRELGLLRFEAKDCAGASAAVERFESGSNDPDTINAIALFKTCLGRREEAVALFQKSLRIKPGQPGVVQSLNLLEQALHSVQ
jgi:predicted AlkP superfamily phosphohydrolase/phosphomutase/Tfp pilus assembly protein PilF